MREITKTVYKFNELDETIQTKLIHKEKNDQLEFYETEFLYNDVENIAIELLRKNFTNAIYNKIYYDLSYDQGSGAMIEFDINLYDANKNYNILDEDESEKIKDIGFLINVKHDSACHYVHEKSFTISYYNDMDWYNVDFKDNEAIERKIEKIIDKLNDNIILINEQLTRLSYELIDEYDYDVMDKLNDNEYFKDGTVYYE